MLELGVPAEAVPDLESATAQHPHDERLCGLLTLALYRAGRQGDALARLQSMRTRLSVDLGLDLSASLRELERKILTRDRSLDLEPDAEMIRSVVVVPGRIEQLDELAALSEPFGLSRNPHEVIFTWLEQPGPASTVSGALAEASAVLTRLRSRLVAKGARARIAAFTALDRVEDTLRVAARPEVDLLVLGCELDDADHGRFGSELARIVCAAPCDVALWFARSTRPAVMNDGPVVVPFGALEHDWAALELAAWVAATTERRLVLVGTAGDSTGERRDASRLLADAGLLVQRAAGVVAEPRVAAAGRSGLVGAVSDGGLVVVGLSERWSSEGLGATRLELARAAPAPVLFLRRGRRPGGLSPPESVTLYRWSVTAAA
jgi:hypothetical protein